MSQRYDPNAVDRSRLAAALRSGMRRKSLNQSGLAEALGVTHPTVSDWVNEKKTPGADNLERLVEVLDLEWDALTEPSVRRSEEGGDIVRIPHVARVSAGDGYENGGEVPEGESYYSRRELQRLTNRTPDSLCALVVVGDSMEPDIRANDTIVYLPARSVEDDGIYVLNIDSALKVKRVQRYGGGAIELIPSNPLYSKELFVPLPEADTANMYRSRESGLVSEVRVEGKVVFHPRPL